MQPKYTANGLKSASGLPRRPAIPRLGVRWKGSATRCLKRRKSLNQPMRLDRWRTSALGNGKPLSLRPPQVPLAPHIVQGDFKVSGTQLGKRGPQLCIGSP
jgi:hypothetical protein